MGCICQCDALALRAASSHALELQESQKNTFPGYLLAERVFSGHLSVERVSDSRPAQWRASGKRAARVQPGIQWWDRPGSAESARSGTRRVTCARLREGKATWVWEVRPWSRSFSGTLGALQDKLEPIGNALELQESQKRTFSGHSWPSACRERFQILDQSRGKQLDKRGQSSARSCPAVASARIG